MHLRSITLRHERYPTRDHYPFTLEVLQRTERLDLTGPVTLFVGENGTGKSTLLEAIAGRCGIHLWRDGQVRRTVRNPYESRLQYCLDVEWTDGRVPGSYFGSDSFRDFTMALEEWAASDPGQLRYFGGESLLTKSHGQSLMAFFRARYQRRGLYLLDEPETALSPRTQLELLRLLAEMARRGHAQFIVATHSPILLACPEAVILSFDHAPVRPVRYEETEHYRVYCAFMRGPAACVAAATATSGTDTEAPNGRASASVPDDGAIRRG
jgi:predicted ATPase